ncbi:ATP-dependent nuclease [Micromonospora rubida]|uniref:ATP-dependent nuclease n=1 Tax=Micromonospora rubida TaxID=2697657 RepID=A0ABW7SPN9_9ACTN
MSAGALPAGTAPNRVAPVQAMHADASAPDVSLPALNLSFGSVFEKQGQSTEEPFIVFDDWSNPVTYFVGRNGSGKSKSAAAICRMVNGHYLATDRLLGLMKTVSYGWATVPQLADYQGVPIGGEERRGFQSIKNQPSNAGILSAGDNFITLREHPEVQLKVAAFIRRALGRVIEMRESAGFIDPYVRMGETEYSLFRDEGHGLRELVVLLTAIYRPDWRVLVVDEPELHLHPSMARLWLGELDHECRTSGRRAIIVTHEPTLLRPKSFDDLAAVWHFSPGGRPSRISDHIAPAQAGRVTASIRQNSELVSHLVFSPRPVLVEGPTDVAALTTSLRRTHPPEVVAQTDLVPCGGSGGVALWYEIATKMGLDVRAIADLDACFALEVQRTLDRSSSITSRYVDDLAAEPAKTGSLVKNFTVEMDKSGVDPNPKSRAKWLASNQGSPGFKARKNKLLTIWRDANLWLHPQGTLEDVLGISTKGLVEAQAAAETPGPIDDVAAWCAYSLDPTGDVFELLSAAIERIAHGAMQALRLSPDSKFCDFIGATAISDARLAQITPLDDGLHRLTVVAPREFVGYWLDFSRETPSSDLILKPPL